jgi:hypothetical protein
MMTGKEEEELKVAEEVCRRFLGWRISEDEPSELRERLYQVLGVSSE